MWIPAFAGMTGVEIASGAMRPRNDVAESDLLSDFTPKLCLLFSAFRGQETLFNGPGGGIVAGLPEEALVVFG